MSMSTTAGRIIHALAAHQPTLAHSWRVAELARQIAQALGLPQPPNVEHVV